MTYSLYLVIRRQRRDCMEKNVRQKISVAGIYILTGIVCLLLSMPILSKSITLDEAYSIVLVRRSLSGMVQGTAADVHPPLYYFFLELCRWFTGESIVKYRIVTALATYVNLFWLGATLIRRRWGNRVSCFYILWFGLTYCTVERNVIIRMYPLASFLVTATVVFLFFLYENWKWKDYILSIVFTIAAMYTHYYAVMAVFVAWVILLALVCFKKREKLKLVIGGGVIIAIGYIPWMGALLYQTQKVATHYWIPAFDWSEWFQSPSTLVENELTGSGNALYLLVLVLVVMAFVRRNKDAIVCVSVFGGTMLIAALLSVSVASIWQARYMYVAWGVLALAIGLVLGDAFSEYSVITQGAAVCLLCIVGFFSFSTMYHSALMQDTSDEWVQFLKENVKENALVIADDTSDDRLILQSYLPDGEVVVARNAVKMDSEESQNLLSKAGDGNTWFVVNYAMQRVGLDVMSDWFAQYGLTLHSEGRYSIQAQDLEIFSVQGE